MALQELEAPLGVRRPILMLIDTRASNSFQGTQVGGWRSLFFWWSGVALDSLGSTLNGPHY